MRRPNGMRLLPGLALAAVLTALGGCGSDAAESPREDGRTGEAPGWRVVDDPPLSPRERPLTAYVGTEVLVLGGYTGPPCPPNADCAYEPTRTTDGAAYDGDGWRAVPDAPRPVSDWMPHAVTGDQLHVLVEGDLLTYDLSDQAWTEVPTPGRMTGVELDADGDRLLFTAGSDENGVSPDRVLDTRTGEWSTLPDDPLGPSFDRMLTVTPSGLVLTAKGIGRDGGPEDPALVRAAVLRPGAEDWERFPDSDQLGGYRWGWTGERMVDPSLGGADGGEVNGYGRIIPYGGTLDPGTGRWTTLPDAPEEWSGGWRVEALDGPVIAAEGWLYDDRTMTWTRLPRPDDAPEEPGPAVWTDDGLFVVGGLDWSGGNTSEDVYSTGAWVYPPPR